MKIFIIRHGNPNYENDCLTEKGHREAKLLAEKLQNLRFDKIYVSTQGRAMQTAQYTCEKLNMEPIMAPWAREDRGGQFFGAMYNGSWRWICDIPAFNEAVRSEEIFKYGFEWYKHPGLKDFRIKEGIDDMNASVDAFLEENGYKLDRSKRRCVKLKEDTPKSVAIFAHGGFEWSFLSSILGIPYYLIVSACACVYTTGVTQVEIDDESLTPRIVFMNSISHLKNDGTDLFPENFENIAKF